MKRPNVTLTVQGTTYVPVRADDLKRLRAIEKAAREVIAAATVHKLSVGDHRSVAGPSLRKLAHAVRP